MDDKTNSPAQITVDIPVEDAVCAISDPLKAAGRTGYEAHAAFTKAYVDGSDAPDWEDLPVKAQGAWIKAAYAILTSGE